MNNILITSAGRRVSLVRLFKKELKRFFPDGKLFTTDTEPQFSAACFESDGAFKVSRNDSEGYIQELLALAVEQGVKIIIPTIDTGLQVLANNKEVFEREGITVLICSKDLIEIFRDKRKTSFFFTTYGIDIPEVYAKDSLQFPIFIKPYDGSMSMDTHHVATRDEITRYQLSNEKFIYMEYIDNKIFNEYTIDMYYDKNHDLKCLVPRKRIEVRDGEINKGITSKNFIFDFLKGKLNHIPGAEGCLTMQLFYHPDTHVIKAIEVNPRFGGGYPLSYLAGANYPEFIIREYLLGEKIDQCDDWESGLLMLRYDDEILVHGADL